MSLISAIFGNETFIKYVSRPIFSALLETTVAVTLHSFFATFVYRLSPFSFNVVAGFVGLGYLFLTSSTSLVYFTLITVAFYVLFFCLSKSLNKRLECNVSRFCITIYASLCFNCFEVKERLDEYVFTLIVLSVKLLCVTEDKLFATTNVFTLIAYFLYYPWILFDEFLGIRINRNAKNEDWWNLTSASLTYALMFKLVSNDIQYDDVFNFPLKPLIFSIWRGIRYRNMYYYRAHIAQMELLAAGIKKYEWKKHLIFHLEETERAHVVTRAKRYVNKPLTEFVHRYLKNRRTRDVEVSVQLCLLIIVYCNSIKYATLLALFYGGLPLHEHAVGVLELLIGACFGPCSDECCVEKIRRFYKTYWVLRGICVLQYQFRISLLFIDSNDVFSSFNCLLFLMGLDIGIIAFCPRRIFLKVPNGRIR